MRHNLAWRLFLPPVPVVRRGRARRSELARTGPHARTRRESWLQHLASAYGVAALLVVELVLLSSAMIWNELAGDQFELGRPTQMTSEAADTQRGPDQLARRPESVSTGPGHVAPRARSVGTPARATTISGTALAVALIAALHGIGLLVLRALRRRREVPSSTAPESPPVEDESPEQETDDAPEIGEVAAATEHDAVDPGALELGEDRPEQTAVPQANGGRAADRSRPVPAARPDLVTMSNRVVIFDRRLSQRVVFVSRARLQWPGHDVACTTANLSMQGVRCDLAPDLPPESLPATGTPAHVTLDVNGTLAVLRARVGWCRVEESGAAMGLQFVKLRGPQEALLQGVVISGAPV